MSAAVQTSANRTVTASLGRRVGAFVLDMLPIAIIGAITGVIQIVLAVNAVNAIQSEAGATPRLGAAAWIVQTVAALLMFAWWLTVTIMQGGRGSVGQRMCGIRLVGMTTAEPIGFWHAVWRNIVFWASCIIPIGYFTPLFDAERHRGWHDLAAGALMVDSAAFAAGMAPGRPATGPVAAPAPAANPFLAPPTGSALDGEPRTPVPPATFAPTPASAVSAAGTGVDQGMISAVPGGSRTAPGKSAASAGGDRPAAATPTATAVDAGIDETRAMPRGTHPAAVVVLAWDDGTRMSVHRRTLFGRNPQSENGTAVLPVRDETLSLSKTHFVIDSDASGASITDLDSTNGTALVRAGVREKLAPGVRVALRSGDRLEFGDRVAQVESP